MIVNCNIDNVKYNTKPNQKEIEIISPRIGNKARNGVEFKYVIEQQLLGYTITPAFINGRPDLENSDGNENYLKRCNNNFSSQSIFVIDADGMLSYNDFKTKTTQYNILPAAVLPSFNHSSTIEKFHAYFVLPYPVYDKDIRKVIYYSLFEIFTTLNYSKIDESVKDEARLIFGTNKQSLYENYNNYLDAEKLIYTAFKIRQKKTPDYKLYFEEKYKLELNANNDMFNISVTDKVLYNSPEHVKYLQISHDKYLELIFKPKTIMSQNVSNNGQIYAADFSNLEDICEAYYEFISDTYIPGNGMYDNALMVSSNLNCMEDGLLHFTEILTKNNYKNKQAIIKYCTNYGNTQQQGGPIPCSNCKYLSECESYQKAKTKNFNQINILNVYRTFYGSSIIPNAVNYSPITLSEGEIQLRNYINQALNMQENKNCLIIAPTGIGKTEAILPQLQPFDAYAVPDHTLLNDVIRRYIESGNPIPYIHAIDMFSNQIKKLKDESIDVYIKNLIKIGDFGYAIYKLRQYNDEQINLVINKIASRRSTDDITFEIEKNKILNSDYTIYLDEEQKHILKYLQSLDDIKNNTDSIIFCTHSKLLSLTCKTNRVIIDEDIMDSVLLNSESTKITEFEKLSNLLNTISARISILLKNETDVDIIRKLTAELTLTDSILAKIKKMISTFKKVNNFLIDNKKYPKYINDKTLYFSMKLELKKDEIKILRKVIRENAAKFKTGIIKFLHVRKNEDVEYTKQVLIDDKDMLESSYDDEADIKVDLLLAMNKDGSMQHTLTGFDIFKNRKNIILTATANVDMYKQISNIDILKIDDVENKGTVEQYLLAMGRSTLEQIIKDEVKLQKLKDIIIDDTVITFKNFKDKLKLSGFKVWKDGHYNKTTGQDTLKGQNITVLGTPFHNPVKYVLAAFALGYSLKDLGLTKEIGHNVIRNPAWSNKTIYNHNVDKFNLVTFNNTILQKIQMHFIETELIQAVGRARALREEDAQVQIISNFPIKGAKYKNMKL